MKARFVLVILLATVMLATRAIAGDDRFKIIVNPQSGIESVDRDFLREAYLKKATEWGNGETIHPLDLSSRFAVRERFTHDVLHKTSSQLKTYWNQQIFSGKGVPPPEAESTSDAVAYVLANKGAVAYLPADADTGKAKVIPIR